MHEQLMKSLHSYISATFMDSILSKITIYFNKGYTLYIRYNDYNEYSYQFIYSKLKLDRFRYDNYDDTWNVSTSPHHFHPRGAMTAINSPMKGIPENDAEILIKRILIEIS